MIVSAPQSTQYAYRFSCASTWNEPREFPNNPAAVDCQRHVLLYISAGKLINRPAFDYDSDDFILGLFLGVQASYAAIMMAELTSLCLSTTLLIAIYQVS